MSWCRPTRGPERPGLGDSMQRVAREAGGGLAALAGDAVVLRESGPSPVLTCCTGSCSSVSGSQTSMSSGFLPTFWKWWDRRGRAWGCTHRGLRPWALAVAS